MAAAKRPLEGGAADAAYEEGHVPLRWPKVGKAVKTVDQQVRASLRDALADLSSWQVDGMLRDGPAECRLS